ncbi:MAG: trigger factor [Candidatus Omnitrophota bacterium]|nr:trigger factor [Candidatus Omnitrophota bacterium]MBU1895134.1 trigger factor [Candidatus Omnitrophota bacterium]
MKSKMNKLDGTSVQFEIEIFKEKVDEIFNEVFSDIQKTASIKGFRSGKAPLDIIKTMYKKDASDEVKKRLIPTAYQSVLEKHNLNPVSYPEVWDVAIEDTGEFKFKIKVEMYPEIKLKNYKGLKVATEKISVTDKEVESALSRVRNIYAEFSDVERPIEKGDFAVCDVETFSDGEVIAKKRENMWVEASKEASLLGVGEELCGMKVGDEKDIEVTLPEKYPDKKYAGRKAMFKVKIKQTKEKKLPELNAELAKKMGKDTLEDAKTELKQQLLERKEADSKIRMKNQLMEKLLKDHSFDLPSSMVERQLKVLMERAEEELVQKGIDKETICEHKVKLEAQLKKESENKVKLYFILDKIASNENIDSTDEEIDNWLKALALSYQKPFDEIKKYYQEHNLIGGLKEQLREEKTLDFLLSTAAISGKQQ